VTPLGSLVDARTQLRTVRAEQQDIARHVETLLKRTDAMLEQLDAAIFSVQYSENMGAADRQALRDRRQALGLSQQGLATHAAVSRSEICEIERGKRDAPDTRLHLASVLAGLERQAGVVRNA
jgi:DNA-binding XRE family transcriptional regulator